MAKKTEYQIGFTGLADGVHDYTFKIGKKFFEQLDYSDIQNANLDVQLKLEKKPNMLLAAFSLSGTVNVMCDRCTDFFDLQIKGDYNLIYKFSEQDLDDENVVTIYPNETEINVAQPIYELTILLIPPRKTHPNESDCNQEMLNDIDKYLIIQAENNQTSENINEADDNEVDPRWAALQKLKNNKN